MNGGYMYLEYAGTGETDFGGWEACGSLNDLSCEGRRGMYWPNAWVKA